MGRAGKDSSLRLRPESSKKQAVGTKWARAHNIFKLHPGQSEQPSQQPAQMPFNFYQSHTPDLALSADHQPLNFQMCTTPCLQSCSNVDDHDVEGLPPGNGIKL